MEIQQIFHFIRFETKHTREAIEFIASQGLNQSLRSVPCTGGGAHKVLYRKPINLLLLRLLTM